MDLGIKERRAIVCAASKGLGKACAMALAREGVDLVINARGTGALEATAADIHRATGVNVVAVAADITTGEGRARVLAACPEPDILINNAGGPPAGDFRQWGREQWLAAIEANMLTPILLIRATVDGMAARNFGRIVNITTSAVKAPGSAPALGLSIGARSGLTAFVASVARQFARHNVTVNALLPGPFATDRMRALAAQSGQSPEEQARRIAERIPAGRAGVPDELGAACAFLCSVHAGFITGQNIVMDGGAYTGLM